MKVKKRLEPRRLPQGVKRPVGTPLTEERLAVHLEGIKDLIVSTAKGVVSTLRQEMDEKFSTTWHAISEHSKQILKLDTKIDDIRVELKADISGLDTKIDGVRTELKEEIQGVRNELRGEFQTGLNGLCTELKEEIQGVRTEIKGEFQTGLNGLRTELKEDMRQMERRLSDKIDRNATRLDDHESRLKTLERVA